MGEVGAHKIFHGASATVVVGHGYGSCRAIRYFIVPALLCFWLARLWSRSGPITSFMKPSLLRLAGTVVGEVGPIKYIMEPAYYCGFLAQLWPMSEPIRYFTELALLYLDVTFVVEVGVHKIFHGASISVDGWHGYGRGRGP